MTNDSFNHLIAENNERSWVDGYATALAICFTYGDDPCVLKALVKGFGRQFSAIEKYTPDLAKKLRPVFEHKW